MLLLANASTSAVCVRFHFFFFVGETIAGAVRKKGFFSARVEEGGLEKVSSGLRFVWAESG